MNEASVHKLKVGKRHRDELKEGNYICKPNFIMGSNILFHEKISDASFCDAYDTRTHMIVVSLSLRFLSFFFRSLKFGSQQIKMIDAYIFHESNYVLMNAMFVYFYWVKCKGTYASGKSLLIFATEKTKLFHLQILLEFNH